MRENKGIPEILGSAFFSATVINTVIFVKKFLCIVVILNNNVYNNIVLIKYTFPQGKKS